MSDVQHIYHTDARLKITALSTQVEALRAQNDVLNALLDHIVIFGHDAGSPIQRSFHDAHHRSAA